MSDYFRNELPADITIEDLNFIRMGHSVRSGSHNWHGRVIADYKHVEEYRTKYGSFSPKEWNELALATVLKTGMYDLFLKVKEHCKNHCFWINSDDEYTEHALSCMAIRAYEKWEGFENV